MKLIQELIALSEQDLVTESIQDKIEGLETGSKLFNQRFVVNGFYNAAAKKIVADKLAGRFVILSGHNFYGNHDVRDRHQGISVNLGQNGHGFSDKASAQAYLKVVKGYDKKTQKRDKEKGVHEYTYEIAKVEDIDSKLEKMKAKPQYKYVNSEPDLTYA